MTDEERCDALVKAGILWEKRFGADPVRYQIPNTHDHYGPAKALSDWRVAGACLERFPDYWIHNTNIVEGPWSAVEKMLRDPYAIIKAFVEAKTND